MPTPNPEIDVRRLGTMALKITVLPEVVELLGGESLPRCESPSLRLEKIVRVGGDPKKDEVSAVVACHQKRAKRIPPVVPKGAVMFSAKLGARLIVNQAGGVLENAGLCLHRHYGDPYIPGSAVKGIARHAAWCEWCDEQDDGKKQQIAQRIVRVFGYPTGDKALDDYLCPDKDKRVATAGNVCFFAAVPEGRVALAVDIVTPHGGNDWSDPVPSPFPVVEKDVVFRFVLSPRGMMAVDDVEAACNWLRTGVCHHGIGTKNNAGYGWFEVEGVQRSLKDTFTVPLKLISPAFLRGGTDDSQGVLRVATLRGLLRWWWRYLFRSIMKEQDVKNLEAEVWGAILNDKPHASLAALRLISHPERSNIVPFNKEEKTRQMPRRFRQHRTSGIAYLSYGMDERVRGETRRRMVLEPGAEWTLEITARAGKTLTAAQVLDHVKLALMTLCAFGGVGSRSRKGFGSLDCGIPFPDDEQLFTMMFSAVAGTPYQVDLDVENIYSFTTSLSDTTVVKTQGAWQVLDRIGYAIQTVASSYKHRDEKAVLGLPRQIHGPRREPLRHQRPDAHRPPYKLRGQGVVAERLASPLCVHIAPDADGLRVNLTAFPSSLVRSEAVSERLLDECIEEIKRVLSTV